MGHKICKGHCKRKHLRKFDRAFRHLRESARHLVKCH